MRDPEQNRLLTLLEDSNVAPEVSSEVTEKIFFSVLQRSQSIRMPNFEAISSSDLSLLFDLYDEKFFEGLCRKSLKHSPLHFRISSRMTRAGGKTTRVIHRNKPETPFYEICVSSTLLFDTFRDVQREVLVTGVPCQNRLQALQKIFEHELVHLIEMLIWEKSSCSQKRFQSLAKKFFCHEDYRHELITPRERALKVHGIQPGSRVMFAFEGTEFRGVVNRITKRATVLVEDRKGRRYTDGKRYSKFYVPLEALKLIQ